MDIQTAADLLEIDLSKPLNITIIKKNYHRLALQTHPDKNNNSPESTERFKIINEAYQILLDDDEKKETTFESILHTFLNSIVIDEIYKEIIISIINEIINADFTGITVKLFEKLNKEKSIQVYEILCKYKRVFFVSQEIIDEVKKIIQFKFVNDKLYILNPTLDDLFNNNVFILTIDNVVHYIPLWHEELCFDLSDDKPDKLGDKPDKLSEMVVKCMPDLPDNVSIDEDNNICVKLNISILNILNKNTISFKLGGTQFDICVSELHFKKIQYYTFKAGGISKINEINIYDVSIKSDIIVMITFI